MKFDLSHVSKLVVLRYNGNNGSSLSIYFALLKKINTCRVVKNVFREDCAPLYFNNAYNALSVIVIFVII